MEEAKVEKKIPWTGLLYALGATALFFLSWFIALREGYVSHIASGGIIGVLLGCLIFILFAYRTLAESIASRMTEGMVASREWFKSLYELAQIPYLILSDDGLVRLPNKAVLRLYGVTQEDIYEKKFTELFAKEDENIATQYLSFFLSSQPVIDREIRIQRANGDIRWVLLSILSYPSEKRGEHTGLVALVDITSRKEVEKAKTDFISTAAHQLRAPLAAMKWYLESLATSVKDPLTEKQASYLNKVYLKNESIIELVNLLLTVSRVDAGALKIEATSISVPDLISKVVDSQSIPINDKSLAIQPLFAESGTFRSDPKLLTIIIDNLLSNAVKYTPKGGTIIIQAAQTEGRLVISVSDTGYGIPEEVHSKIFSEMFRADNAQLVDPGGTGLGLYLSRKIAAALGGTITFVSQLNKGTTFTVSISPLA